MSPLLPAFDRAAARADHPSRGTGLRFAVLATLLAVACSDPIPAPFLGCVDDYQCANGRCANGLCVPNSGDAVSLDAAQLGDAIDDAGADAAAGDGGWEDGVAADVPPIPCVDVTSCPEPTSGCLAARCTGGVCGVAPLPSSVTCATAGVCPAPGRCDGAGACQAEAAPCDDGNPCTADQCGLGGCKHVAFADTTPCETDGLGCTTEACTGAVCAPTLAAGWCLIGGACAKANATSPSDPCQRCAPTVSTTTWTTRTEGDCDDGSPCTVDTGCDALGDCTGEPVNCDDSNVCTNDVCLPQSGCVHLSNTATCTDGDPCTSGGACSDGACVFQATLDCDDGNPCTKDSCAKGFGCFHAPQEATCTADADPCTDDVCVSGACVAVPSVSVCKVGGTCVPAGGKASGNACLVCKPEITAQSWTKLSNVSCQDGDACTLFDACAQGKCIGQPISCDDKNPCTKDSCDTAKGCVFQPISGGCNDGDACTIEDTCLAGSCKGTPLTAADCGDNNPCTQDSCSPITGCDHKPHNQPCDDGDACTKGDFCTVGKCAAGKLVCPCEFNNDCDDNNPCTIDVCVTGVGCSNTPKNTGAVCSDGDACTGGDHCVKGVCKGAEIGCDDGNPCTLAACSSEAGCLYKPVQGKTCDDGDACSSADLCVDGTCMGTPKACDDGKACTLDGCDKATGVCSHSDAKDGTPCPDDGVGCTLDRCLQGGCNHNAIASSFCLIQGTCLSGGAMHPAKQCLGCQPKSSQSGWSVFPGQACNDGNACTAKTVCQTDGSCKGAPLSCDDSNPCTLDACNPQLLGASPCVHTVTSGSCDDGSDCTSGDVCKGATCTGKPIVCSDGDVCTDDGCQATGGCVFQDAVDGKACGDDGLPCTTDMCSQGVCVHAAKSGWCAISTGCYPNGAKATGQACLGCSAKTDSTAWSPLTGDSCDDGDPCTGADACLSGTCKGDPKKACDDDNVCTADSCNALTGCTHAAIPGSCDDGNPCTASDTCVGGACSGSAPVACSTTAQDAKNCVVNVCLPAQGGCTKVSSCGALHTCHAGLCLTQPTGKPPGPVALPISPMLAAQPLRPTLAWQESHTGKLGVIPQLWVVAQTAGCSPSLGVYARLMTIQLTPGASSPAINVLQTPAPTGGSAWCGAHPVLSAHPTTYDALALTWLEGGNEKSACPWGSYGGRSRVALVGVSGDTTVMTAGAACPAAGPKTPLPWRPTVVLHGAKGSIGKTSPGQLSGVLIRAASAGGAMAWRGDVVADWGGNKGKKLPEAKLIGWSEAEVKARSSLSAWTAGHVLWQPTSFKSGAGKVIPALTASHIDPVTGVATGRQVVVTGAPVAGTARYDAVETVFDASSKRVATLLSGRATANGKTWSFLAFARLHPSQGAAAAPAAVAVVQLTPTQGPIQAFRIARLPNSDAFLVVWAPPGSTVLKALRINPKDDTSFTVTSLGAIAADFVSHPVAAGVDSSGGLSELVIDPSGGRYSIAYEGVGALHLLTAALPSGN